MAETKSKRAPFPRTCDYTKAFQKDYERLSRSGRFDMNRLKEVMLLLIANDAQLGAEWFDHPLKGKWARFRECHVGGDFLLVYEVDDAAGKGGGIIFVRTGTHTPSCSMNDRMCQLTSTPNPATAPSRRSGATSSKSPSRSPGGRRCSAAS